MDAVKMRGIAPNRGHARKKRPCGGIFSRRGLKSKRTPSQTAYARKKRPCGGIFSRRGLKSKRTPSQTAYAHKK